MRPQRSAFVLLLALCACAPNSELTSSDRPQLTVIQGTGVEAEVRTSNQVLVSSATVAAPVAAVWPSLTAAFQEIGLPVTQADPRTRAVASQNQRLRRIGGRSPAAFFECAGAYGNSASRYDVYVTVQAQLVAEGTAATSLRTAVDAVARPPTNSGSPVQCTSSGALEELLAETVQAKHGATP